MQSRTIGKLLAAALALSTGTAPAQTVQKCSGRDGHVRYQSEPCGRGERTIEVWSATPDPVVDVARSPRRRPPAAAKPRKALRVASTQGVGDEDACANARAYRDAAERRAGLARNYDLLSTLQRRVFDACR